MLRKTLVLIFILMLTFAPIAMAFPGIDIDNDVPDTAHPGETILIPVELNSDADFASGEFTVTLEQAGADAGDAEIIDIHKGKFLQEKNFFFQKNINGTESQVSFALGQDQGDGNGEQLFVIEVVVDDDDSLHLDDVEDVDITISGTLYKDDGSGNDRNENTSIEILPLYGDVDLDGSVTVADAILALRAAIGLEDLSDAQENVAIVRDSGSPESVSSADATLILRYVVGLIDELPQ